MPGNFRCGHPRTHENAKPYVTWGIKKVRCRTCYNERMKLLMRKRRSPQ